MPGKHLDCTYSLFFTHRIDQIAAPTPAGTLSLIGSSSEADLLSSQLDLQCRHSIPQPADQWWLAP